MHPSARTSSYATTLSLPNPCSSESSHQGQCQWTRFLIPQKRDDVHFPEARQSNIPFTVCPPDPRQKKIGRGKIQKAEAGMHRTEQRIHIHSPSDAHDDEDGIRARGEHTAEEDQEARTHKVAFVTCAPGSHVVHGQRIGVRATQVFMPSGIIDDRKDDLILGGSAAEQGWQGAFRIRRGMSVEGGVETGGDLDDIGGEASSSCDPESLEAVPE
ncbi:hypothetical protein B0H16DRAFT_1458253 [Mycena metata]|uniref:Pterin-binding domain-containing protein n=1 Tax=Mycena metata TaxID=1033252 RepID=A0AAD7J4Y2_9AGAR|nr:hypothetical protein B0H16DRAFT_1458253 [Mycena metata]